MNTLISTFGKQKRWVNWVSKTRDNKTTKVPLGKSNDPTTWSTYDNLKDKTNIGLMFGLKKMLLGIDIDKCIENGVLVHEKSTEIEALIKVADTYCEISPSGTGLHLFLNITEPLTLQANRKDSFECYTSERYFTVTQNPFINERRVRTVTPIEAEEVLAIIGYPWKKEEAEGRTKQMATTNVSFLDDEVILKKMFGAKNGAKVKALYEGDTSQNGGDDSIADLNLCSHLAFYTNGDALQIERLWLGSPLGARGKTQDRKDYRDRTITKAITECREFYKPKQKRPLKQLAADDAVVTLEDLKLHYTLTKDGDVRYSLIQENINIILEKHPYFKGRFRYDEFLIANQIKMDEVWEIQRDIHEILIQSEISVIVPEFNRVSMAMVKNAMSKVSHDNRVDSAISYIKSLTWDKTARIDTWLQTVFGVENIEYTQKVGSNWMKGLVSRMIYPGCQFDYILVIEGKQGLRKSTAFRELVTDAWHLETERSPGDKDFFVEMAGKAIIELSEGQSNAIIDVKKMKSILTKRKDTYRSPYARIAEDHPRRSVFCMTTNDDDYLKDTTGDRRWWPVECTHMADIAWIRENRDQLFAEAYHRLIVGKENTYDVPEDVAAEKQEERRRKEPNTYIVVEWYNKQKWYEKARGITTFDAYIGAFFPDEEPKNVSMSRLHEMEIGGIFRTTLKLTKKRVMKKLTRIYRYYDDTQPMLTDEEADEEANKPINAPSFYKTLNDVT